VVIAQRKYAMDATMRRTTVRKGFVRELGDRLFRLKIIEGSSIPFRVDERELPKGPSKN